MCQFDCFPFAGIQSFEAVGRKLCKVCRCEPQSRTVFEAAQSFEIPLEVFQIAGMIQNVPIFLEAIEFETRKAEQLPSLEVAERAGTIAFDSKRFEGLTSRVGLLRDVRGKINDDLHGLRITTVCGTRYNGNFGFRRRFPSNVRSISQP